MRAPAVLTAVRRLTRRSSGSGTVGPEEFLRAAASLLNLEELAAIATAKRADYMAAQPFPHAVIDGLFDDAVLDAVLAEFSTDHPATYTFRSDPCTDKRWLKDAPGAAAFGHVTRHFLHHLNSLFFLDFLTSLTGIDGLLPDPYYEGAGLHETLPGGWLKVHADFNRQVRTNLDRRINVIVYLNKDWPDEYGGHLELWSRDMQRVERVIAPRFNRTVIFSTSDHSYHGQPEPLRCPPGRSRKSVTLYYYTNGRPDPSPPHQTLWQERPAGNI